MGSGALIETDEVGKGICSRKAGETPRSFPFSNAACRYLLLGPPGLGATDATALRVALVEGVLSAPVSR